MSEGVGLPELTVVGETYRFAWDAVEAEVERIAEHRDELTAEVTIRSARLPRPGLIHSARLNLMSTQARKTLVGMLTDRESEIDWGAVVEAICFMTRERYRRGEPSIDLREPIVGPHARWLVEPYIESEGAAILFADGGTGKSMIALALAVTAAAGTGPLGRMCGEPCPVLYLDWETSHWTATERLGAILAGCGLAQRPPIHYRRMYASLQESVSEVRREVTRLGAGLVIVDALGAARGGEPESADTTIRLFNAARSLGVPWLGVDHVTKAAGNDATKPFGSAFSHNLARLTWGADKAQDEGSSEVVVSLRNHKRNNGRLLPRQGWRISYQNDEDDNLLAVRFAKAELADTELGDKLPLKQRIWHELTSPRTPEEIIEALGASKTQVYARLKEMRGRGDIVKVGNTFARVARNDN